MSNFCYFENVKNVIWEIIVWVCFNADRMMKDQTKPTICRLYHRIIKNIKQSYLEIWHGKE